MNAQNNPIIFVVQITDNYLKMLKCGAYGYKKDFLAVEYMPLDGGLEDIKLTEKIHTCFTRLQYSRQPIIIALARNQAACRWLKLPAQDQAEILNIASLQASRYLPYPQEELITGFDSVSFDKDGFTTGTLIIAHKAVIEKYLKIFNEFRAKKIFISLSSQGINSFLFSVRPDEHEPVMVVDADKSTVEVVFCLRGKLLFSRCFKYSREADKQYEVFIQEIKRTQEAYIKELACAGPPSKIILLESADNTPEFAEPLKRTQAIVEVINYNKILHLNQGVLDAVLSSKISFLSLMGMSMQQISESVNLLPQAVKDEQQKSIKHSEFTIQISLILALILVLSLAAVFNSRSKSDYLKQLERKISGISLQAQPLERLSKMLEIGRDASNKDSCIDILYELHTLLAPGVSLTNFIYEAGSQIIINGQTQDFDSVFRLASLLEKGEAFKQFKVKVRYATKRQTQDGEIADFEIVGVSQILQ